MTNYLFVKAKVVGSGGKPHAPVGRQVDLQPIRDLTAYVLALPPPRGAESKPGHHRTGPGALREAMYQLPQPRPKQAGNFEAVASFPASYYVLPQLSSDLLLADDGTERHGWIGDASNWFRNQWGLLRDKDGVTSQISDLRISQCGFDRSIASMSYCRRHHPTTEWLIGRYCRWSARERQHWRKGTWMSMP